MVDKVTLQSNAEITEAYAVVYDIRRLLPWSWSRLKVVSCMFLLPLTASSVCTVNRVSSVADTDTQGFAW